MMVIPHACVNAAVGRLFKNPASALAAGILGHAALDLLPHKDISAHKAEGLGTALVLGIIGSSCGIKSAPFWCAIGGVLPDVEQVLPWTDPAKGKRRWFPTHSQPFHSIPLPGAKKWRVSLLAQTAVSLGALIISTTRCREKCKKT